MKEKFLLAIVITLALSWIHGLSLATANRTGIPEEAEDIHRKSIAQLMQE